jgi:hypothetical protein
LEEKVDSFELELLKAQFSLRNPNINQKEKEAIINSLNKEELEENQNSIQEKYTT